MSSMCWKCGQKGEIAKPGFREICLVCGKDLHVCRNCRFYKPGAYRDCAETVPDGVTDKERGNFCEYFQLNQKIFSAQDADAAQKGPGAKSDFDKLFGG
jgi:hypothetical protein